MNSVNDEVQRKIRFLELAKEISNISKAAKIMGFSKPTYYNLKKIYDAEGEEGLRRRKIGKPQLSKEIEKKILEISSNYPKWGALKIHKYLSSRGIEVSETATYDVLKRNGINLRSQRLIKFGYKNR